MIKYSQKRGEMKVKLNKQRKKSLLLLAILNILAVGISLIYNLLFERGKVGRCHFFKAFGLYCPGCGGSRSLNALLNFNPIRSFIYYPPILISSLLLLYADVYFLYSAARRREFKFNRKFLLIIPVSILLSFVVKYILLLFGIDPLGNIL